MDPCRAKPAAPTIVEVEAEALAEAELDRRVVGARLIVAPLLTPAPFSSKTRTKSEHREFGSDVARRQG